MAGAKLLTNLLGDTAEAIATRLAKQEASEAAAGIRAYHSSPHDFDKFDLSKIGTGEGNQTFGYGIYAAESPEVSGRGGDYWKQFHNKMKAGPEHSAANAMYYSNFDRDRAIQSLLSSADQYAKEGIPGSQGMDELEYGSRLLADEYRQGAEMLSRGEIVGPRTYELNINAAPEELLDLDADVYDFNPEVLKKLENLVPYDNEFRHGFIKEILDDPESYRGGAITDYMNQFYKPKGTSELLREKGILGSKYLDGWSRIEGQGTNNYVIFDPSIIDITKKYADGGRIAKAGAGKVIGELAEGAAKLFGKEAPAATSYIDDALALAERERQGRSMMQNYNVDAWHGSPRDIPRFKNDFSTQEGYYGGRHYFSSSVDDVNANYATPEGADIANRTQRQSEEIQQNGVDDYNVLEALQDLGHDFSDIGDVPDDLVEEAMQKIVRDSLGISNEGAVYPVKLRMENPVRVGGKGETFFDFNQPYDEIADEWGEPSGKVVDLVNSLRANADAYGIDPSEVNDVIGKIYDDAIGNEGISVSDFERSVRDMNIYYDYEGNPASPGALIADIYQDAGYDSIDMDAFSAFGPRKLSMGMDTRGMVGLYPDTRHYIKLDNKGIRSRFAKFNPDDIDSPDIDKAAGGRIAKAGASKVIGKGVEAALRLAREEAPAVIGKADPGLEVLRQRALEMELPKAQRTQPSGFQIFETTPEAYKRTPDIVPQEDFMGRLPRPVVGKSLPLNERMLPILDIADDVAAQYASKMAPYQGKNVEYFYHTGPVYEKAFDLLGDEGAGRAFMDRFSKTYAGTSPRTPTEQNLLNSSLLSYRVEQGLPLERPVLNITGNNDVGYPMISGMHPDLTRRLLAGEDTFPNNPKPSSFAENVRGNLQGVTADTHNIRGILVSYEDLRPGSIPREWFKTDADYDQYLRGGLTPDILSGGINDSLASQTVNKVSRQSEYGPMADITARSAEILGEAPAPTQSLGWFGLGGMTNLRSAPKTLTELIGERIDVTAQKLGVDPDEAARLYMQGKIPLMNQGGAVNADADIDAAMMTARAEKAGGGGILPGAITPFATPDSANRALWVQSGDQDPQMAALASSYSPEGIDALRMEGAVRNSMANNPVMPGSIEDADRLIAGKYAPPPSFDTGEALAGLYGKLPSYVRAPLDAVPTAAMNPQLWHPMAREAAGNAPVTPYTGGDVAKTGAEFTAGPMFDVAANAYLGRTIDPYDKIDTAMNLGGGQLLYEGYRMGAPLAKAAFQAVKPTLQKYGPAAAGVLGLTAASDDAEAAGAGLFSKAMKVIRELPMNKMEGNQALAMLKKGGIGPEELQYTGLADALPGRGTITKDELIDFVGQNDVQLGETILSKKVNYPYKTPAEWQLAIRTAEARGNFDEAARLNNAWETAEGVGGANTPKFEKWSLPGGGKYQETLITMPPKKAKDQMAQAREYYKNFIQRGGEPDFDNLSLPQKEGIISSLPDVAKNETSPQFMSGHWDQPNVIAHIRTQEFPIPNPEGGTPLRAFNLDELQSDWAQEGRKGGFKNQKALDEWNEKYDANTQRLKGIRDALNARGDDLGFKEPEFNSAQERRQWTNSPEYQEFYSNRQDALRNDPYSADLRAWQQEAFKLQDELIDTQVLSGDAPLAPYVQSTNQWTDLGLKKGLSQALDRNADMFTWTPGDVQAKRYDLSKEVSKIHFLPNENGTFHVGTELPNGQEFTRASGIMDLDKIEKTFGKDIAKKVKNGEFTGIDNNLPYISGEDLSAGGQGMKDYYNNIVPKRLTEVIRKATGEKPQFETFTVQTSNGPQQVQGIRLTPEMKAKLQSLKETEGGYFSHFAQGGKVDDSSVNKALQIAAEASV